MNNLNGNRKNEFRRKQEEKQRKLALKIEDEAGEYHSGKNAWIKSKIAVLCEGESLSQVVKRDFCSSVKW